MPLWDQVKGNLVEWYAIAADKTEELAKVGARKYDRFGISRELERRLAELGGLVYDGLQAGRVDVLQDPALQALVARIGELERDLELKEQEIERIRGEHRERSAGRARSEEAGGSAGGPIPGSGQGTAADAASEGKDGPAGPGGATGV